MVKQFYFYQDKSFVCTEFKCQTVLFDQVRSGLRIFKDTRWARKHWKSNQSEEPFVHPIDKTPVCKKNKKQKNKNKTKKKKLKKKLTITKQLNKNVNMKHSEDNSLTSKYKISVDMLTCS